MKNYTRILALLLALVMVFGMLAGCSSDDDDDEDTSAGTEEDSASGDDSQEDADTEDDGEDAPAASTGGIVAGSELNVHAPQDMANHTPKGATGHASYTVVYQVFEGLTKAYHGDWDDIRPHLAEDYTISDDGLEYVFQIRQGVYFINKDGSVGDEMTVDDVVYSFEMLCIESPGETTQIDTIEATGDWEVTITMSEPFADFIKKCAMFGFAIRNQEACEQYGYDNNDSAIGTGPYYIESYDTASQLTLKANENYWDADNFPSIETVNMIVIPDNNTAYIAFNNGELDIYQQASYLEKSTFEDDENVTIFDFTSPEVYTLHFNASVAPFDDIRVRQALNHMINKDDVNAAAFDSTGRVTNSYWASLSPVYISDSELDTVYDYDPDKGLELLAEAGYEPSDISFEILYTTDLAIDKAVAENLQAQFMSYGMNVSMQSYDWMTYFSYGADGDFEAWLFPGGANYYSPITAVKSAFSVEGMYYLPRNNETEPDESAELEALVAAAQVAKTVDEQNELIQAVNQYVSDKAYGLPMVEEVKWYMSNSALEGLYYDTSAGYPFFQYAYWAD